ncbi:MAG: hypothetical protein PVF15_00050 [Candidatus Bathyarchaeota archaeon]|jgi:hypothetical protein
MVKKRTLAFTTLAVLAWAALTTTLLGYFYIRFQEYVELSHEYEAAIMRVNIYIHYGNETGKFWYNDTIVPLGIALLNATETIADVESTPYPGIGVLVDSIGGVANSVTEGKSWFWWNWDTTNSKWIYGEIGADQHMLHRGDIVAWTYRSYETWPPPPPS